ncbi:hypothetical protein Nmel_014648 [Mimus melanotis]
MQSKECAYFLKKPDFSEGTKKKNEEHVATVLTSSIIDC